MQSTTKHEASKKNFVHTQKVTFKLANGMGMTNHMRLVSLRAKKMGITSEEYMKRFPKV